MSKDSKITGVELAILDWVEKAGLDIRHTDIEKGKTIQYPAAFVFTQTGTFSKVAMKKFKCELGVFVIVAFRDVKSEKKRRHGLYPILEGIIQGLMFNDLELAIRPLIPKSFRNVTDRDMREKDVIAFEIAFATSFTFTPTPEEAVDLIKIGLEYYLQDPVDDETMDAQDIVTLQEE